MMVLKLSDLGVWYAESMYTFLEMNDVLPHKQNWCRRKSRGTKDQLLIDMLVLKDCKKDTQISPWTG